MINSGIYMITNIYNGKCYIGSSTDMKTRIRNHKNCLKSNKHANSYLQASYNKYGKESFTITIVELVEDFSLLTTRETAWILKLKSNESSHGYNMSLPNTELLPNGGVGLHSEETKFKLGLMVYTKRHRSATLEDYIKYRENRRERKKSIHNKEDVDSTVVVYDKDNGSIVGEYANAKETSNTMGLSYKRVNEVLNLAKEGGKTRRSYKGYVFVYKRNVVEGKSYRLDLPGPQSKRVLISNMDGEIIGDYINVRTAAIELGIKEHYIYGYFFNKLDSIKGIYTAKYIE